MKIGYTAICALLLLACFAGCSKVLDKKDLGAVNESDIWKDDKLATAYINKLYEDNLPGWNTSDAATSDEAPGGDAVMYGQLTINSFDLWPYDNIRNINILLKNIDGGTLPAATRDLLKGQAFFFRAWRYFQMVRLYGGVPLILEPQQVTDNLAVARTKTSACIGQMVADLDNAAKLLPPSWTGNDAGRITKGAALALKGRILLYYASPQFNPANDPARWQKAYDANKAAKETLEAAGIGLYDKFAGIWLDEMNKEVVFVNRYSYPDKVNDWNAATRPLSEAQNSTGANHPTLEMVNAFPMKNGLPVTDPAAGYDAVHYWRNRDPRFAATIAYNGCPWELSGKAGRRQWNYVGAETQFLSETGFYCKKAVDVSYSKFFTYNSSTDWVEIRFAEVLMNLAECANETGKTGEAYEILKLIRKRAGIEAGGDNLYGLKNGMTTISMRDAVRLERKIEFAYEGKRYWDLRRWKLFEQEMNGKVRHGLVISLLIPQSEFNRIQDTVNLDRNYSRYFKDSLVAVDKVFKIDFKSSYYFYPINTKHLELNGNLKQTNGWDGGAFDPLQ
ncbi:Starch-binding associating with outer membrane [Chitinophaga eiseniae]|uniref:Starch-binding associating with outer membrane n=1 Tax=Chitinophaga eiseniae TaxID=634771 RepID=A0A1T4NXT2_9BACT|nr:RagB/SusD family nutrient uptake outer membrane protein [Chitinophaga eiseniae]SJZ83856.1 Starch-binding associating with outer membrane [Chitinophaga eiseniae]